MEESFFPGKIERSEPAERREESIRPRELAERSEASDRGSKQLGGLGGRCKPPQRGPGAAPRKILRI